MGTRADFYVGRGAQAEWLGSIAWDGYPDGLDAQLLNCTSVEAYRHALADFLKDRDDVTLPEHGWPWPWDDSGTTDYAYAFDDGRVWASCFRREWFPANKEPEDYDTLKKDVAVFPNMKDRKNVQFGGKRSGLIVIGS